MTKDVLKRATEINGYIDWADDVLFHIEGKDRLTFKFQTTDYAIYASSTCDCPGWLVKIIEDTIRQKKEEWLAEFCEL